MSGSGISWAICKSAPRSRQTTMPVPHHSNITWTEWNTHATVCLSANQLTGLLHCCWYESTSVNIHHSHSQHYTYHTRQSLSPAECWQHSIYSSCVCVDSIQCWQLYSTHQLRTCSCNSTLAAKLFLHVRDKNAENLISTTATLQVHCASVC